MVYKLAEFASCRILHLHKFITHLKPRHFVWRISKDTSSFLSVSEAKCFRASDEAALLLSWGKRFMECYAISRCFTYYMPTYVHSPLCDTSHSARLCALFDCLLYVASLAIYLCACRKSLPTTKERCVSGGELPGFTEGRFS